MSSKSKKGELLLEIKGLKIQGFSDEKWHDIVNGVDISLRRGEVTVSYTHLTLPTNREV